MAMKRPPKDNDATMDVSMSQLVVPRPAPPRGNNPKNDMSLWGGVMVGTQDFTPEPVRPIAPQQPRRRLWLVLALVGVAALGAGFFAVRSMTSDDAPAPSAAVTPPAPVATPTPVPAKEPEKPAPAEPVKPAEPAKPEPTVAAVEPPAVGEVDAISGVAPIIKPAVKKKPARKKKKKR